jgi:hypothetical protein
MLALDVGSRGGAHPRRGGRVGQLLERADDRGNLCVAADRHLERDVVRELREPADVAHDERLAEGERADRAARGLAHRRRAEQDAGVAGREQRPETRLLDVRLADDPFGVEAEPLEAAGEIEARRLFADEQQPRGRVRAAELGERAKQLRDALVLVEVAEAPDER